MYTNIRRPLLLDSNWFRAGARATAAVLVVIWLALVVAEVIRNHFETPATAALYQGLALAVVFAGYAIGWRYELAGGLVAILGTIAFFWVNVATIGDPPDDVAAIFALPGVLQILAWYSDRMPGTFHERQP
jgi:hypothetical protein